MSSSLLFSVVFSNISRNSTKKEILLYLVSFNALRSQLIHFCILNFSASVGHFVAR